MCQDGAEVMEQNDKGDAHEERENMMERGQGVADGEWSDAESVVEEEADGSQGKSNASGNGPGKAPLNHGAQEYAYEKNPEGDADIVQVVVHQPFGKSENRAENGTGS